MHVVGALLAVGGAVTDARAGAAVAVAGSHVVAGPGAASGADVVGGAVVDRGHAAAVALHPADGPASGGARVLLTGPRVGTAAAVRFDGVRATALRRIGPGALSVVPPAHEPGPVDVTVAVPGRDPAPLTYTYVGDGPGAVVDGIAPDTLPTSGGRVAVDGAGLGGVLDATVGGLPVSGLVVTDTRVSFVAPAVEGEGGAPVVLALPDGELDAGVLTYVAPRVDALTPATGGTAGGDVVTITGSGLATATGVDVGGTVVAVERADPDGTTVEVRTPAHAPGVVDATVLLDGSDATLAAAYTYDDGGGGGGDGEGAVRGVTPTAGPAAGGTYVTLTGTGLAGVTDVTFGGTSAVVLDVAADGSSVVVEAPLGMPGTVDLVVVLPGRDVVLPGAYTYVPDGTGTAVTGLAPATLPTTGGTITVTGSGLHGATGVTVGGVEAADVRVAADGTWVTAVVAPVDAPGRARVTVWFPAGTIPAGEVELVAGGGADG
ncbi:IPT/TIG domain-containing protein [Cellulomonas sp. 179-A 9B4 NHS]|uniref:IPT/TIG domain-containing protein n=1 Tax=Cellulomonas sp. 179-A 9B4 NHS TaxID=3142379 RepID=UPI0039A23358